MKIISTTAVASLTSTVQNTRTGVRRVNKLGSTSLIPLPLNSVSFQRVIRIYGTATVALSTASGTSSLSAPYVPPVAQVITLTLPAWTPPSVAGTWTAVLSGSSLPTASLTLEVKAGELAGAYAGRLRDALTKKKGIRGVFTVSGTGTAIVLTRVINHAGVSNDGALDLTITPSANLTGFSPVSSSITTAGATADGAWVDEEAGIDGDGADIPSGPLCNALLIEITEGGMAFDDGATDSFKGSVFAPGHTQHVTNGGVFAFDDIVFSKTGSGSYAEAIVTVGLTND